METQVTSMKSNILYKQLLNPVYEMPAYKLFPQILSHSILGKLQNFEIL